MSDIPFSVGQCEVRSKTKKKSTRTSTKTSSLRLDAEEKQVERKILATPAANGDRLTLTIPKVMSDEEIESVYGEFLSIRPDTHIIDCDADIYKEDGTPLLHFRKRRIRPEIAQETFHRLKRAGKVKNNNRGIAAGKFDMEEFLRTHKNVKEEDLQLQKGGFMVYFGDKSKKNVRKQKIANYANSGVIGWLDTPNRMRLDEGGCRLTSFSEKHMKDYESTLPFFHAIDQVFQEVEPERHARQIQRCQMAKGQIGATAFSTITVNYNWRTALHTDRGDYGLGFGCFSVAENLENKESFGGCELYFPQYNVAVDVRHGDVLLFDSHQWHCNNDAVFEDNVKERLSFVCYLRVDMLSACTKNNPYAEKQWKGFKLQYRPGTTDEKAMDEVCKTQVYQNRGFKVEEGDVWLDCGAQIGSFTIWALKHGASKVISVEPHPDNQALLKHNTYLNIKEDCVDIKRGAVRWELPEEKERLLWVSKDKNTYRHSTFKVRGRESIPVDYFRFEDLLTDEVTAVKMDIEGAEREILENITDWKNVRKLVFEYHFTKKKGDRYNQFETFHTIMNRLRDQGFTVHHKKLPDTGEPNYFPADEIVYCWKETTTTENKSTAKPATKPATKPRRVRKPRTSKVVSKIEFTENS